MNVIADRIAEQLSLVPLADGEEDVLCHVLRYVLAHYREDITQEGAAREAGVSRFSLSRLFAERMGCSFSEYVSRIRVECSLDFLRNEKMSVSQVGEACGFQSESSFFRHFRSCMGATPLQYRKRVMGREGKIRETADLIQNEGGMTE